MSLQIQQVNTNGIAVLEVVGKLDTHTAAKLELRFLPLAAGKVLLDCSGVTYVSSAGLRVLLKGAKKAKKDGGKVVLAGLNDSVREVFDISGFSSLFHICPGREAGLSAF